MTRATDAANFGFGGGLCHDRWPMQRPRLGDLLVSTGRVSAGQLDEALAHQKTTGRRLGETLIELGHVSDEAVAQTLSEQLSVPWVTLSRVEFSRELLNLVSAELASKWLVVPIYVRNVRKDKKTYEQTLFVATDDPLNETALSEVATHTGMLVKAMVASASELRSAIRIYYGIEMPELVKRALLRSMPPIEIDIDMPESAPPPKSGARSSRPRSRTSRPRSQAPRSGAPAIEVPKAAALPREVSPARESERPKKKRARMLTLTLLDGTTVSLPTAKGPSAPPDERLTTRDLIQALDARAQGRDVKSVLEGATWESLFATLLSLLLRKGLVADWEFVEEWDKHRHGPAK
jgi:type IV pilus assembly protein PilB